MFSLTDKQLEAAKAAKSPEELVALAKEQGVALTHEQAETFLAPPVGELSDEELENVAGGGCGTNESVKAPESVRLPDGTALIRREKTSPPL